MSEKMLLQAALEASKLAYIPYSKFAVGAAILLKNNEIIKGCNIENASYGLTNCAERTALFSVYAKGYNKEDIAKIAVVGASDKPISPCGACRQVLLELAKKDCPILLSNFSLQPIQRTTPQEMLPFGFLL
jgi:cytidine deaminase